MSTKSPEYTHFLLDRTFLSIITAIHHFHNTFYPVSLLSTENKKDRRKSKTKTCDARWLQDSDRRTYVLGIINLS